MENLKFFSFLHCSYIWLPLPKSSQPSLVCVPQLDPSTPWTLEFLWSWVVLLLKLKEVRPYYEVKKDEQEMILKVNLPGVDNKGTKVWVEEEDHGALCFKAVPRDSTDFFAKGYEGKFLCDPHLYLLRQSKCQVNNGVLKIVVPKKTGAWQFFLC